MSLRSAVFRTQGYWVCPASVSAIWVNGSGPGGGGDASLQFQAAKGAGGSGEFWLGFPMAVVAGATYFVDPGSPGTGNTKIAPATSAAGIPAIAVAFNNYAVLPGNTCAAGAGATQGGDGGGPGGSLRGGGGGAHTVTPGTQEGPCSYGGSGGGIGGAWTGGMQIGQYQTPSGGDATYGGTGGSGPFGAGGIGNNVQGVVAAGGAYGAGGAGGVQGSPSLIDAGGLGGGGLMMLFWIEH